MRETAMMVLAALTTVTPALAQTATTSVPYSTPDRGGSIIETAGGTGALVVGYARLQPSASTSPAAVAIFSLHQNGVVVSEAGVPGTTTMLSGRTYAEVQGPINTGVAFANPNSLAVVISFSFTDQFGNDFGQNSFTLNPNAQIAKFLNEAPFSARSFTGALTFNASAPVGVIALRTFANERNEFLATAQPVASIPGGISGGALLVGHYTHGGGWRTQVVLVNTTDAAIGGTVQFYDEGSATAAAAPVTININGQVSTSFSYTIRPRASVKLQTSGATGNAVQVGSVRITPDGATAPSAFAIVSFSSNGVTVSEAAVQTQPLGTAFRTYVEVNSDPAKPPVSQSGIAIANNSSTAATVNFEITALNGLNSGLRATVIIPPMGHLSKYVQELFPLSDLPSRGILRVSSSNSIAVVSFRMRYNERDDLLITTIPVSNEALPSNTAELVFPHIVDGGGFATQFVLFSAITGQVSQGTLRFIGQNGQVLNVSIR